MHGELGQSARGCSAVSRGGAARWGAVVASEWLVRGHSWVEWPPRAGLPARRRGLRHPRRSHCASLRSAIWPARSESDVVPALAREHLPRLVRRGALERELVQYGADLGHLLGVALRELSLLEIDAV